MVAYNVSSLDNGAHCYVELAVFFPGAGQNRRYYSQRPPISGWQWLSGPEWPG